MCCPGGKIHEPDFEIRERSQQLIEKEVMETMTWSSTNFELEAVNLNVLAQNFLEYSVPQSYTQK